MKYPNLNEEKKLWSQGYKVIAGLDEAGRGPLAGPVVAAAILVKPKSNLNRLKVKNSKAISAKQREILYTALLKNKNIKWGIGIVSEKVIDRINILNATKLAMRRAIKDLRFKIYDLRIKRRQDFDFLLIDGNFSLNNVNIPQKSIIKADEKVFSCVAAGIVAKVSRDKMMQELHLKYPNYGFDRHKGYGTHLHFANLKKFGPSKVHRKTFYPVSSMVG